MSDLTGPTPHPTNTVPSGGSVTLTMVAGDQHKAPFVSVWTAPYGRFFQVLPQDPIAALDDEESTVVMITTTASGRQFQIGWLAEAVDVSPVTVQVSVWDQPASDLTLSELAAASFERLNPTPTTGGPVTDPRFGKHIGTSFVDLTVTPGAAPSVPQPIAVSLTRSFEPATDDQALWMLIRQSTEQLSFTNYSRYMDLVLCLDQPGADDVPNPPLGYPSTTQNGQPPTRRTENSNVANLARRRGLPFPDVDAYRVLKTATERFMQLFCGVLIQHQEGPSSSRLRRGTWGDPPWADDDTLAEERLRILQALTSGDVVRQWNRYIHNSTLPYLELVRQNLNGIPLIPSPTVDDDMVSLCEGVIREKLTNPCFIELIWSYWHEEGMLVQTMKAISWRFQNRRGQADRDPLALLEIDPLRPLSNLLWGYLQDEQHRLTIPRRAYEYDHHYGITLLGKAVPQLRGADTRSRFIEAFHNLLHMCGFFYKEDDDTTVVADGFPILNALREVHLLLTQGAHNQYGDLPWTSRQEMLMEQWLLARPEFREYLPRRIMVDYPESWMHSVETMKTLQGWTDTSILHFHDLGKFGERIVLSIRFRDWTSEIHPESAANWARYWRPEIQGYVHAYRAVTGVDLSDHVDTTLPAELLRRRLTQMAQGAFSSRSSAGALPSRGAPALASRRTPPALGTRRSQSSSRQRQPELGQ